MSLVDITCKNICVRGNAVFKKHVALARRHPFPPIFEDISVLNTTLGFRDSSNSSLNLDAMLKY